MDETMVLEHVASLVNLLVHQGPQRKLAVPQADALMILKTKAAGWAKRHALALAERDGPDRVSALVLGLSKALEASDIKTAANFLGALGVGPVPPFRRGPDAERLIRD